jgi:hypothetical protein
VLLDQACDGGSKGALLVGADPYEEPVGGLDAGGERGADSGAGADANAALEHRGGVADASWMVLASCVDNDGWEGLHTKLELTCPYCLGWVSDEAFGEVALHTADHVVVCRLATLADDAEGVVLHDRCATDAAQKTLLHAALEAEDCDFGRWDLNFDWHFAESDPGDEDAGTCQKKLCDLIFYSQDGHEHGKPEFLRAQKRVGIGVPFTALDVVEVAHDNKDPGHLEAVSILLRCYGTFLTHSKSEPSNEAMMLLKYIMVSTVSRVRSWVVKTSWRSLTFESREKHSILK